MSRGPAAARNAGAALATGEVLMFLDADAVVHSDTLRQVEEFLSGHEEFACVFGSYDAQPAAPGWVSWYRNLLHHYVHQRAAGEVASFWAGCGAVRRAAFEAVGGFNEGFRRPSVEDIELGWRLRAAGHRIWLHPEIQVQHLKAWTFASMLTVDIRDRAALVTADRPEVGSIQPAEFDHPESSEWLCGRLDRRVAAPCGVLVVRSVQRGRVGGHGGCSQYWPVSFLCESPRTWLRIRGCGSSLLVSGIEFRDVHLRDGSGPFPTSPEGRCWPRGSKRLTDKPAFSEGSGRCAQRSPFVS